MPWHGIARGHSILHCFRSHSIYNTLKSFIQTSKHIVVVVVLPSFFFRHLSLSLSLIHSIYSLPPFCCPTHFFFSFSERSLSYGESLPGMYILSCIVQPQHLKIPSLKCTPMNATSSFVLFSSFHSQQEHFFQLFSLLLPLSLCLLLYVA